MHVASTDNGRGDNNGGGAHVAADGAVDIVLQQLVVIHVDRLELLLLLTRQFATWSVQVVTTAVASLQTSSLTDSLWLLLTVLVLVVHTNDDDDVDDVDNDVDVDVDNDELDDGQVNDKLVVTLPLPLPPPPPPQTLLSLLSFLSLLMRTFFGW